MRAKALVAGAIVAALGLGLAVRVIGGTATGTAPGPPPAAEAAAERPPGPPVASQRSEEGARAAAVTYATASQDWLYLSDEEIDRAVRAVATPAAATALSRETVVELRAARDALRQSPGRVWWLVRPLASRVERFEPTSARVVVWAVTVLSASDVALPQAEWMRVAVDLAWLEGAWRIQAVADTPGPTPMTGVKDRPWQPEPLDAALDGFQRAGSTAGR